MRENFLTLGDIEEGLKAIAAVAISNERYFCELDGESGDADFGTSLATGFRAILRDFDEMDRSDIGAFLVRAGVIFSSNVGGTSGPIWGTALMRAGMIAKGKSSLTLADLAAMGNHAIQGIMARGGASAGDKTVLDALIPAVAKIEEFSRDHAEDLPGALQAASHAATASIEGTRQWPAKRGRQSYSTERTVGTLDPGIVAVALMLEAVVAQIASSQSAKPSRKARQRNERSVENS